MPKREPSKPAERENHDRVEAAVRPFWSGTLSFGLVSIPVNLFPGNRNSRVSLRMLGPDGHPLKREYVSPEGGAELQPSDTTRAFEIDQERYVTVTDEELERLAPEKSRNIDLRLFVEAREVSPLYFERSYFLTPADASAKAYRLLAETMQRKERAGIATFVMRGKEYLVAIFADHGILRAETMRFADEIRSPADIGLPKKPSIPAGTVRKFESAIVKGTRKTIDREEMRDEYAESMRSLIEKKSRRDEGVIKTEVEERRPEKVVDLMEVLKKSLQGAKPKRAA